MSEPERIFKMGNCGLYRHIDTDILKWTFAIMINDKFYGLSFGRF